MDSRMVMTFFLSMLLLFAVGCSSPEQKTPMSLTSANTPPVRGTYYTTIIFDKGRAYLNSDSKENLRAFTEVAHQSPKRIEEIRVLAWADSEYPDDVKGKASQKEVLLAGERAQNIQNYLEEALNETGHVDSYNMAKRPNLISKLLKSDDYKVKRAFENTGMTGDKLPDGNVSYTKASKAIVIIDYEGKSDDLKR